MRERGRIKGRGVRERLIKEEKEERRAPHGCYCQLWEPR